MSVVLVVVITAATRRKKTRKTGVTTVEWSFSLYSQNETEAAAEQTLEHFAENKEDDENGIESSISFTTDVAARGLDIPGVRWMNQI